MQKDIAETNAAIGDIVKSNHVEKSIKSNNLFKRKGKKKRKYRKINFPCYLGTLSYFNTRKNCLSQIYYQHGRRKEGHCPPGFEKF